MRAVLIATIVCACGGSSRPGGQADAPKDPHVDAPHADDGSNAGNVDPADDGSATVTESTKSFAGKTAGRTLPSTVYTPDGAGPFPLVVVSPGFQMARAQYASYSHHLATWGFVVVLTDYADSSFFPDHQLLANDVSAVIDGAIADLPVDPDKVATAGHSLGGKISVFAATQDARIKAVVGWDPVDSSTPSVAPEKMGSLTAAVAVVGETTDGAGGGMPCAPTADNFASFFAASPSPAIELTIATADHMDWVDDGTCAFCTLCAPGTASETDVHAVTRRLDVAWLRKQLLADASMDPWLATPSEGIAVVTTK